MIVFSLRITEKTWGSGADVLPSRDTNNWVREKWISFYICTVERASVFLYFIATGMANNPALNQYPGDDSYTPLPTLAEQGSETIQTIQYSYHMLDTWPLLITLRASSWSARIVWHVTHRGCQWCQPQMLLLSEKTIFQTAFVSLTVCACGW